MKECPRCGSSLSHYSLADGEAYGCDGCGWVGVDVEHGSTPARLESWHDAISRFEAKFGSGDAGDALRKLDRVPEPTPVPEDEEGSDPEPTVQRVPDDVEVPAADEPSDADGDVTADDAEEAAEGETGDGDDDRDDDVEPTDEDASAEAA